MAGKLEIPFCRVQRKIWRLHLTGGCALLTPMNVLSILIHRRMASVCKLLQMQDIVISTQLKCMGMRLRQEKSQNSKSKRERSNERRFSSLPRYCLSTCLSLVSLLIVILFTKTPIVSYVLSISHHVTSCVCIIPGFMHPKIIYDAFQPTQSVNNVSNGNFTIVNAVNSVNLFLLPGYQLINATMAPEHVRASLEESLKRLKTSYVDLFLIHFPVSVSVSTYHNVATQQFSTDFCKIIVQNLPGYLEGVSR